LPVGLRQLSLAVVLLVRVSLGNRTGYMQAKSRLAGLSPRGASASFFWRERGNDFFEARVAAQRIPHRTQAQVAITWTRRYSGELLKLLKCQVTFARPGTNHGKPRSCRSLVIRWAPHRFLGGGHQFYRAPAFAQRLLLSSLGCIDQPEVHWSPSFQLRHAKVLCPLAGLLQCEHE